MRKLGVLLLALLLLAGCAAPTPAPVTATIFVMDTFVTVSVYGESAETAVTTAVEELYRLERLFSVTNPDSDIAQINRAAGQEKPTEVAEETARLLTESILIFEDTAGVFSPLLGKVIRAWGFTTDTRNVPEGTTLSALVSAVYVGRITMDGRFAQIPADVAIDLGGVAKGFSGDLVVELLHSLGVSSAIVSVGGDVVTLGARPDGSPWRVAIRDPHGGERIGVLELLDNAVSTSGAYERWFYGPDGNRYHHILDPATGWPAVGNVASATVIAPSGIQADALATALFVMGAEEGIVFAEQRPGIDAIFVLDDGTVLMSSGVSFS